MPPPTNQPNGDAPIVLDTITFPSGWYAIETHEEREYFSDTHISLSPFITRRPSIVAHRSWGLVLPRRTICGWLSWRLNDACNRIGSASVIVMRHRGALARAVVRRETPETWEIMGAGPPPPDLPREPMLHRAYTNWDAAWRVAPCGAWSVCVPLSLHLPPELFWTGRMDLIDREGAYYPAVVTATRRVVRAIGIGDAPPGMRYMLDNESY
jgi:hypothetical protein